MTLQRGHNCNGISILENTIGVYNSSARREIKKVEDNGGKSLSKEEEMIERESTNELKRMWKSNILLQQELR